MSEELKPCPFCGEDATQPNRLYQSTLCKNPKCKICAVVFTTVEQWNTRAPDPRVADLEAQLELVTDELRHYSRECPDCGTWTQKGFICVGCGRDNSVEDNAEDEE